MVGSNEKTIKGISADGKTSLMINSKYWGDYSTSDLATINNTSILSGGDINVVTPEELNEVIDEVQENEKVTANALNILNERTTVLENIPIEYLINVTYSRLVEMRNNYELKPGQQYRITDYITTTSEQDTQSAGHKFDIIVTANSENSLCDIARAYYNEDDSYFVDNLAKLEAWQIWYSLDNDTNRFAWADSNGKGVIYRMIDEWDNDCPYDFKNIMFKRKVYNDRTGVLSYGAYDDDTYDDFCYTFSWMKSDGIILDGSIVMNTGDNSLNGVYGFISGVYNNKIKPYNYNKYETIRDNQHFLNNNVFFNSYTGLDENGDFLGCYSNIFGYNCTNNTFNTSCRLNSLGDNCCSNFFGIDCVGNSFGDECSYNSFGNYCAHNNFKSVCGDNIFGNYCSSNILNICCDLNNLGDACTNNIFGKYNFSNILGENCDYNSFGDYCQDNEFIRSCNSNNLENFCESNILYVECQNNIFGKNCSENILNDFCYGNIFESLCGGNELGISCAENVFKNSSSANKLSSNCCDNIFGSNSSDNILGDYCGNNEFGNDCFYNNLGINCEYNIFGNFCTSNDFEEGCYGNNIGFECGTIKLKCGCVDNTFGNGCNTIILGDYNTYNSFGNGCLSITLGADSTYNSFGNGCNNVRFTYGKSGLTSGVTNGIPYMYNVHCGDGVINAQIHINTTSVTITSSNTLKNIDISQGFNTSIILTQTHVGKNYAITISKNSSGTAKAFCLGDLAS